VKKPGDPIDRVAEGTDQATQEFTAELWNAKADQVEPMASTLRLEEVLKRLHDSEINAGLQSSPGRQSCGRRDHSGRAAREGAGLPADAMPYRVRPRIVL